MESQQESNFDYIIQKFISILRQNDHSSYICPQKELVCFCERNFHMTDLDVIEPFIRQMNYYSHIDIDAETDENEISQRLSSFNLDDNFKQAIVKNLLAMKLDKKHLQKSQELITTVKHVECERLETQDNPFRINFHTYNPNDDGNSESNGQLSFVMNREQMTSICDEMDKIRQQLFHSVG
ncbi:hypothetical protein HUG17_5337 [Dermatophagoides farinae]|uniref:Uncharacterized protein n=1 Tax=Dermatophagoides farinae TaxID=6954 RepID=A0A9D4SHP3_DERFA|nr:uncharacterized protein LOC124492736 [Dermatophagoides farinae]KAH7642292.1 hypothetical protein HUG17_5337 [Dermatophagoides farinae]